MPEKSRHRMVPIRHRAQVLTPVMPARVRQLQRRVKQQWGELWSARRLARELGYSRSTLKLIETGHRSISERFANAVREIERLLQETASEAEDSTGVVEIISTFPVPERYHVLHPIIQCRECGCYFERMKRNQKKCRPGCYVDRGGRKRRKRRNGQEADKGAA